MNNDVLIGIATFNSAFQEPRIGIALQKTHRGCAIVNLDEHA